MIDYIVAAIVAVICLAIGLPAIPQLLKEIKFYKGCQWDLQKESAFQILAQDQWKRKFGFLPIGAIKMLYHINRIAMMLIVVIPLGVGAYRAIR